MDATPAPSEPQADDEDAPIVEDVTPAPTEPHADDADAPEVAEDGFETLLPGVRYKEIARGEGPAADYKQSVTCSYTAECTKTGEVFEKVERRTLRIGDADVPPGLELCLRRQRAGTSAIIKAEWRFAFGEDGRPASSTDGTKAIPSKTDVTWRISTISLGRCEGEANGRDKLEELRAKKDLGNNHFRHGNWRKAAQNYQEVLKDLHPEAYDDLRDEAVSIYVACANNLVFALMKLGEWLKAEQAVCDVLQVAPDDEKALYRAAKIALHLSKWAEAGAAITRGRSLYPTAPAFPRLEAALKTQRAKYRERRKQMGRSMAGALFAVEGAVDEAPASSTFPWYYVVLGGCVVAVAVAVAAAL